VSLHAISLADANWRNYIRIHAFWVSGVMCCRGSYGLMKTARLGNLV
jgi:hypothetical protein